MAIYIQINRIEDDSTAAIYEFGPIDSIAGTVLIDKESGNVSLWRLPLTRRKEYPFIYLALKPYCIDITHRNAILRELGALLNLRPMPRIRTNNRLHRSRGSAAS